MSEPRILIIDGNRAVIREQQAAAGGRPTGEGYALALQGLARVHCDIVRPADAAVTLPAGANLGDYDGVAITGSALNIYDGGEHIERQVELMRAVFDSGVPCFGSCWGLQLAVTAAGGRVSVNPRGREFGFARRIMLNDAGRAHDMYRGKPVVFEAVTVHLDAIETLPPGASLLAESDMGLQAIEMRVGNCLFWGVQYHPEYSFADIAATAKRYAPVLLGAGLFADRSELDAWVGDALALDRNPRDARLCWRHGLGPAMQDVAVKMAELRNWLHVQVLPHHGA